MTAATALIVIDLQAGVLEGCFDADGVVARTRALVERARAAAVPVVWVQHEDEYMPRGSPLWQWVDGLDPAPLEVRVFKTCWDSFADTPLREVLEGMGARRLVVAGAQSDYCIRTTAQRAAADGYEVLLAGDAHTTADSAFGGVAMSGEQIVAHVNGYFAGLRYPGTRVGIAAHDVIAF
ncbi:isochorismatase [Frateuria sp. Soil773]|uniref:isochorismatase family protein n=1 Tax=Frateuria sp. Soil773 TaxID=1736407 RepID=UPI0006F5FB17|nr:isochorismatase family protein [Frateuria sp. Soil773]KRE89849.1 isochorismatase [Frateuria sp. Soil773]